MKQFQQLVAATDNDAYNALICADLGPEIGFESVSQIGADRERGPVRGRVLMPGGPSIEELVTREAAGWQFIRTKLTDEFSLKDHHAARPDKPDSLALLHPHKPIIFLPTHASAALAAGPILIRSLPNDKTN